MKDVFRLMRNVRAAGMPNDALIHMGISVLRTETSGMAGIKIVQSIAPNRNSIALFPASGPLEMFCPWVSIVPREMQLVIVLQGRMPNRVIDLLMWNVFLSMATARKRALLGRSPVRGLRISVQLANSWAPGSQALLAQLTTPLVNVGSKRGGARREISLGVFQER
jgi:hypothetical protein